jgi:hypothetical protein
VHVAVGKFSRPFVAVSRMRVLWQNTDQHARVPCPLGQKLCIMPKVARKAFSAEGGLAH